MQVSAGMSPPVISRTMALLSLTATLNAVLAFAEAKAGKPPEAWQRPQLSTRRARMSLVNVTGVAPRMGARLNWIAVRDVPGNAAKAFQFVSGAAKTWAMSLTAVNASETPVSVSAPGF